MAELIVLPEEADNPQNVALILTREEAIAVLALTGQGAGGDNPHCCVYDALLLPQFQGDPLHEKWTKYLEDIEMPVYTLKVEE